MTTKLTREELVQLAERVGELRGAGVKQIPISRQLQIPQSRVAQLLKIKRKSHAEVWAAWVDGTISAKTAEHLCGLSTVELQVQRLRSQPQDPVERQEWMRSLAAEGKGKRRLRPTTASLIVLIETLERDDLGFNRYKAAAARTAIRHCLGDLKVSEETLFEELRIRRPQPGETTGT